MTGRRFLITGASRGIRLALSHRLAAGGDAPVGFARSAPAAYPGAFFAVDLTDRDATAAALDAVLSEGPLAAVVNNVGLVRPANIGDVDLDDQAEVYDLNVRVAVQVVQAALPGMTDAGWGRIVNITSLVALGLPGRTSYRAAKAALEFLARAWAGEAHAGITANAVAPGPTETELFRANNQPGSEGEARWHPGRSLRSAR